MEPQGRGPHEQVCNCPGPNVRLATSKCRRPLLGSLRNQSNVVVATSVALWASQRRFAILTRPVREGVARRVVLKLEK